jgi:hypothetical protein
MTLYQHQSNLYAIYSRKWDDYLSIKRSYGVFTADVTEALETAMAAWAEFSSGM